jgi:hypothetical protein
MQIYRNLQGHDKGAKRSILRTEARLSWSGKEYKAINDQNYPVADLKFLFNEEEMKEHAIQNP